MCIYTYIYIYILLKIKIKRFKLFNSCKKTIVTCHIFQKIYHYLKTFYIILNY